MPQKTKQKGAKKDSKKAVADAQQKEAFSAAMSPEMMMQIAAEISISPIDNPHKAFFLTTIAQGTFSLDLYERYKKLLSDLRDKLVAEAQQVQQELDALQQEYDQTAEQLTEAALGACKEIQAACDHVEIKSSEEIERRSEQVKGQKIEGIRKQLKKDSSSE